MESLLQAKRAELDQVTRQAVAVFIGGMKKTLDELRAKGLVRI